MSAPVTLSACGRIGVITVNSPPVNALSHAVRAGLLDAVERGGADVSMDALVLICEGRTSIVGADIREFGKPMQDPQLATVVHAMARCAKPIIVAMHGTALGGGFEVALACQYRVATPSTKLGLPEVKLGILPGCGGTQRLPRLIGVEEALKMIVEGNPINAARALELGAIAAVIDGYLLSGRLAFPAEGVAGKWPVPATPGSFVRAAYGGLCQATHLGQTSGNRRMLGADARGKPQRARARSDRQGRRSLLRRRGLGLRLEDGWSDNRRRRRPGRVVRTRLRDQLWRYFRQEECGGSDP